MADSEREEKLAAARKRLKKFQQKRTPSSSPVVKKTPKNSLDTVKRLSLTGSESSVEASPGVQNVPAEDVITSSVTLHSSTDNISPISSPDGINPKQQRFPDLITDNHVDRITSHVPNGRNASTAEKIRQICSQLNGLTNQDFLLNGEDPVINEIEALETRNHELEEGLQSYKRSNEHLNNQVNEQRKQILYFQDQIKRERTELANRQLLEQRSLKEQLEVHIQTIGILVGEKQELQGSLSQLQRKCVNKESENSELTGRLQAVRQKIVELEKSNASLFANLDKYKEDYNHVRQERDRYQTANYTQNKEKEELMQQNAELKVKLDAKVTEHEVLEKSTGELSFKLTQAELIVQQLSTEPNAAATQSLVQQLQEEKTELANKLEQVSKYLKRYELDNEELHQRHTDEVDQFESRIRSLRKQLDDLETEKNAWENKELEMQENIQTFQVQLAETQDDDALQQQEVTSMAAVQIEKLSEEKQQLIDHLQNEARANERLKKEESNYLHKIHELEMNLNRLEEDVNDRASLLESIQGDKDTISRALKQNKELKEKLEQIEDRFIKVTNDNMSLATQVDTEKHVGRELAIKLSDTAVELEETKDKLSKNESQLTSRNGEIEVIQEQLNGSSIEVDSLREQSELSLQRFREQLAQKDFELSSLREEVLTTSQRAETEQVEGNDYYEQYEEQTNKLQLMYKQLQAAEEAIDQLAAENKHLRTILDTSNDTVSGASDGSDSSSLAEEQYEKEYHQVNSVPHSGEDISDEERLQIKKISHTDDSRLTPDVYPPDEGSYIDRDTYASTKDDTDSGSEMDMVPRENGRNRTQMTKYTNREDVIDGLSVSIRQLEMERDQLVHLLQNYQETQRNELQKLQEHMELQLQQQLQQQYRQVQEQFQQVLHDQQQKILLLEEVLLKQKSQIEKQSEYEVLPNLSEQDSIPLEALKVAFNKLQVRFKNVIDEKAGLQDKVQDLEHLTEQLSFETETIEEYVTLYQTQRSSLKAYYNDREKIITRISNEKGNMQNKISQLQALVKQLIEERQDLQQQLAQLQVTVNKRMLAHEHQNIIPGYQQGDEILVASLEDSLNSDEDNSSVNLDNSLDSGRESSLQINDLESTYKTPKENQNDGTAQQILQLLEQLGPSEEGGVPGWMSPAVRTRDFIPCRYCSSSRLLQL